MKCVVCHKKIDRWDCDQQRNLLIWDFLGVAVCTGDRLCVPTFQDKVAHFGRFLDLASCTLGLGYSLYKNGTLIPLKEKDDPVEEKQEGTYELRLVKKKR